MGKSYVYRQIAGLSSVPYPWELLLQILLSDQVYVLVLDVRVRVERKEHEATRWVRCGEGSPQTGSGIWGGDCDCD